jgi:serine protease AprX
MKIGMRSLAAIWITFCALVIPLCAGMTDRTAEAQSSRASQARASNGAPGKKVSSDLRERLSGARSGDERVRVILQDRGDAGGNLRSLLRRNGVRVGHHFSRLNTRVVEVPAGMIDELAADPDVSYISPDREVQSLGHVSATTGADAVRPGGTAVTALSLDGTGVGIAVLDSGIYASHQAFRGREGLTRVAVSVDFTGAKRTSPADDGFGHGTHVAGLAAGGNGLYSGGYAGVAPNARLINLAVLDGEGKGSTSSVLNGLDWVLTNRAAHNIRVVNMSLGTPAFDSYVNDPLCRAVRRLADAGVVVVVAAGNLGSVQGRSRSGLPTPSAPTRAPTTS